MYWLLNNEHLNNQDKPKSEEKGAFAFYSYFEETEFF